MASGPGHETPPADVTAITFRTDAPRADVVASGGVPLEGYRSFLVARGTASAIETLRLRGYRADAIPEASVVQFLAGPVDARDLGRSSAWTRNERGLSTGVVHVHGPFKDAWRTAFEARGVELLRYVPTHAFLVRGTPEALRDLTDLPFVDGIGPFDAAWKVRPGTPEVGVVDVRIVVLPGESQEAVVAELSHRGVPPANRASAGPGILGTFGTGDFRWIRARIPSGLVPHIAALPYVEFIEPVRAVRPLNAETAWVLQTNSSGTVRYWSNGLDGRGQVVAISDTGVDYDHDQFRESAGEVVLGGGDLYNVTSAARRKVVRYLNMGFLTGQVAWPGGGGTWDPWSIQDSDHTPTGTDCTFGHGTAVASVLTGNDNWRAGGGDPDDGLALGAKFYVQDIGTVGPDASSGCSGDIDLLSYIPEDLVDLFGPASLVYNDPTAPVRIHSNSWGSDQNEYDIQARMIDAFVWSHPDMTIVFASGNTGSAASSVDAPATAKNLVTVGGVGNPDGGLFGGGGQNDVAMLSSRGPTLDGRRKPTIMGIFDGDSGMSDGNARSGTGGSDDHWQGTSYSTPSAAAAAAIVRQYFVDGWYPAARPVAANGREPSAALVRAILVASGTQVTGGAIAVRSGQNFWPNNEQGFGRIQLSNVLPIAALDTFRTRVVDGTPGLLTGDVYRETVRVSGTSTVKVVLVWSDYPAALSAGTALVNDLNLEVTAPDGTVYRGNNFGTFAQGRSIADGAFDARNVEEAVILKTPLMGDWTVRVIGANVPVGPQPFALVVTGGLDPAFGRVALDRPTYRPGDVVRLEVEDGDAGAAVQVRVTSGFDTAGEMVSLTRGGPDEVWRGSVEVSFGPTTEPGVQVRDGDVLQASYTDVSPAHTAVATARVDAVGPTVFDVGADRPGPTSARIAWRTDEPATSGVWYGTAPTNLSSFLEFTDLRTVHEARLAALQPDTMYYYDVVARDRHAQETRDTNAGRHYRFRTEAFGDLLLVGGDDSFPSNREATWATAIDANGWTWSHWRNEDAGLLPLGVMQAHRAVLWQVGLEQYPPFDAAERDLVKRYVDGGGRLLVSSHDTAWALADTSSPFYSPEGASWVRGVLKAGFSCDPTTAARVRGIAGDPISGAFTTPVEYLEHRSGGAVDVLTPASIGGTASTVWQGDLVDPTSCGGRPVGLSWVSSASNGTAGVGVWGGTRSRLVYFAFEVTGLDATGSDPRPTSATRAGTVDNAIRWLLSANSSTLDRDHPDLTLTYPDGGTFAGPTITINWTATAGSAPIAGFDVAYSGNGGQTWAPIATVPGSSRSTAWDVGSVPNGDRYLVRIVARDSGTPALTGQDESDGFLSIRRTSGDGAGPTVWAGSVRISPNPPGAGTPTRLNATADDRTSGAGVVAGAEFFLAASEPTPAERGSGTPLDAADGTFDTAVENVTWSAALAIAPGAACVWVHARDAAGNWGPYEASCFVVLSAGPDVTPPATARVMGVRLVNARADIEVTWAKALDDSLFGGATTYRAMRSTSAQAVGTDVSGPIPATGAATYTFVDGGTGEGDSSDFFYRIESADAAGNVALSGILAAKVRLAVAVGTNLLGMPVDASDPSLAAMAGTLAWASAWSFDGCAATSPWSSAIPSEAATFVLPSGRGFWLNATAPGALLIVGLVPSTGRVDLCAGWNLVALPGFAQGVTVGLVKATTGADAIVGFDAAGPYGTRALADSEILDPGKGVWIHVPSAVTWTVAGS